MSAAAGQRRAWVERAMGTRISLHLRGADLQTPQVEDAVARVYGDFREIEALLSPFRASSQISALNRGEVALPECDPIVREVADLCDLAKERTDGYFDANVPFPEASGVRGDGPWFNPTGLVKGWAVERAAQRLRALSGCDFCLNAGGDILVGGAAWKIGIENPTDLSHLIARVRISDGAIATSGTTYRGVHILVPQTGAPAEDLLTATVVGPSLVWADIYATAAVARGRGALRWLTGLEDYAGLVVKPGGDALVTPGWPVE